MERMTIHRALSELKLIDAKIDKAIGAISPTGMHQKGKLINGQAAEEDFKANAHSYYDSALELMDRKTKIKSRIVESNGTTQVTIAEIQMTVADAINAKAILKFKKKLIDTLTGRHKSVLAGMNQNRLSTPLTNAERRKLFVKKPLWKRLYLAFKG